MWSMIRYRSAAIRWFLTAAAVSAVIIPRGVAEEVDKPAPLEKRIVLVGDSTIASGNGWGDALAKLLKPGVECINMGRGGRSSKSYRKEGHWKKVLELKPGWVLIQFGHNDQPGKGPERETDAKTTFRENLTRYISEARSAGAMPVLVTSLTRRNFNAAGKIDPQHLEPAVDSQAGALIQDSLTDYVEAAKAVATEQKVPLIDLNARSVGQMNQMGPQAADAFDAKHKDPNRIDKTHLSAEGAKQTAALVADEIRLNVKGLEELLLLGE
ncbi:MAG: rhamnogalacturonan acetylesterase [Verrucomicrobiaceae bacterium]|nr:MAG: rhamnogalacturonan acetylesterase [Verrucomicrobiaceae bacterium]